jgi:hypothetical protein
MSIELANKLHKCAFAIGIYAGSIQTLADGGMDMDKEDIVNALNKLLGIILQDAQHLFYEVNRNVE